MTEQKFLPALRVQALTRFYDPIVGITTREALFKRRLLEQVSPRPEQRILDLGCGTGTLALLIKRSAPDIELFGVDADPAMLLQAKAKARSDGHPDINFDVGLASELPYEDGSFDQVVSTLFFHHLTTEVKRETAAEIARVLRPEGQLHIADWGRASDPAMRALSLSIRLLDGFEPTRDNFIGRLPKVLEEGGLIDARLTGQLRTAFGTMALYAARNRGEAG